MGFKANSVQELLDASKKMWLQVKPEELAQMVEKGLNASGSTSTVKDFLYGSVGVEPVRRVKEGIKSIMGKYGITDAKALEAALAKAKGE